MINNPEEYFENKKEMNSTRRSKCRDATSLHPVMKTNPFDLSYSLVSQSSTASNKNPNLQ